MSVLVTGAAGFIGAHVTRALLARGETVLGLDNLNAYYDPSLKRARLEQFRDAGGFTFRETDVASEPEVLSLASERPDIDRIVHLAAQAGVRYSLENPFAYADANVRGQVVMLELARRLPALRHFVYASSSSVYGDNAKLPFSVEDPVERPISVYAATKRAAELLAETYAHLYRLPMTGLRFFTVYGPWGRPDMAYWQFTEAILSGREIKLFNRGEMRRDFTYIDDIVEGVVAALDRPARVVEETGRPHRIYNLGNHRSEDLRHFIRVLERACGREARVRFEDEQPGDMRETFADIESATRDLGYRPGTTIEEGLPRFVAWFRRYYDL